MHRRAAEIEAERAEHLVDEARGPPPRAAAGRRRPRRSRRRGRAAPAPRGTSRPATRGRPRRGRASRRGRRHRAAWPGRSSASSRERASVALARHADGLHRAGLERPELGRREDLATVDELEAEAQVGLVGPVALHRLVPRHALDHRRAARRVTASTAAADRAADDGHHVVGVGEAHLHVELHELELAVGAQVLVAQAARDLVVAVEAADHQQLLEQLRALRQRVERARATGATGRRSRAHPRASTRSASASRPRRSPRRRARRAAPGSPSRADAQVALQARAAQVEVAVAQAEDLVGLGCGRRSGSGAARRR